MDSIVKLLEGCNDLSMNLWSLQLSSIRMFGLHGSAFLEPKSDECFHLIICGLDKIRFTF